MLSGEEKRKISLRREKGKWAGRGGPALPGSNRCRECVVSETFQDRPTLTGESGRGAAAQPYPFFESLPRGC